jgi:amino-acid N-acetyltransferase
MRARSALLPDAARIHELIEHYARTDTLLPRSLSEICENVRDFVVIEEDGGIVGCGALHLYGPHLAEIRSIAVDPGFRGHGTGRLLVEKLLGEAKRHRIACVCLFTRIPDFFARFGFSATSHGDLPDKIYKDCLRCPKLHACDEVAMVRGRIPKLARVQRRASVDRLVSLRT